MNWTRVLLWVVLIAVLAPFVLYAFPQLMGADKTFTVRSGSMEPAIPTGATIFVQDTAAEVVSAGDVITFRTTTDPDVDAPFTTHRVVDVQQDEAGIEFRTKGDANQHADPGWVQADQLVGRTAITIPYMGYLLAAVGTVPGYIVFILLPAVVIILGEGRSIYQQLRERSVSTSRTGSAQHVATEPGEGQTSIVTYTQQETRHSTDSPDSDSSSQDERVPPSPGRPAVTAEAQGTETGKSPASSSGGPDRYYDAEMRDAMERIGMR